MVESSAGFWTASFTGLCQTQGFQFALQRLPIRAVLVLFSAHLGVECRTQGSEIAGDCVRKQRSRAGRRMGLGGEAACEFDESLRPRASASQERMRSAVGSFPVAW